MKKISIALLTTIFLLPSSITATKLHDACKRGNLQEVEELINSRAKLNAVDIWGDTPLYIAVKNGHEEIVKLLLKSNVDVNAKNNNSWTPLHKAACDGNERIVKLLLESNVDVNAKNNDSYTPLHWAAEIGHEKIAKLLINNGADAGYTTNENGYTPLHIAVYIRHGEVVRQLTAAPLLLKQSNSVNSQLSKEASIKLDAYYYQVFSSVKCLSMPVMKSIAKNMFPIKKDDQKPILRALLKLSYQDLKDNPEQGQLSFANLFVHGFYKNHLAELKLYIGMKNSKKQTAIDVAKANNKTYLESIEKAQNYNDLKKDLREQTEINYKQLVKYNG